MSTELLILRDDAVHSLSKGLRVNLAGVQDFELLIDDSYFFYLPIGALNMGRQKARRVAENYLSAFLPLDIAADFIPLKLKGKYIALLYKNNLAELIKENSSFFSKAKRVSTPFVEACCRYDNFTYFDGVKVYERQEDTLKIVTESQNALTSSDITHGLATLTGDMPLPGLVKLKGSHKRPRLILAACACLFFFTLLAGETLSILSLKKAEARQAAELALLYKETGVAGEKDPYAALEKSAARGGLAPFRISEVLNKLGNATPSGISIENLTINERSVRIEGGAPDFATVDNMKNAIQKSFVKEAATEQSRGADGRIKFSFRFEP